ncbi:MAG TPA: putative metalloprotease CJM1_0395 family protein [Ferrovibrio sp.]|uniref:putative metalloprotease CJM1_0395 family protein n=1 Tax=Ferrovibrio sp. TaxID=1917215 RepID=UPI002ED1C316
MSDGLTLSSAGQSAGLGNAAFTRRAAPESGFPGLKVFGGSGQPVSPLDKQQKKAEQRALPSAPLADGNTLLAAQQQGSDADTANGKPKAPGELSEEEKQQVAKLKQIDAKVRAHERAHAAVGGQYAGAPSYGYTLGPDGQRYATSGEVPIDIGPEKDPHATLQKAAQVAAAALAPADPSGQDRAVAAAAAQLRLQALAQIREEARAQAEAAAGGEGAVQGTVQGRVQGTGPGADRGADRAESPPEARLAGPAARAARAYAEQAHANQSYANDNPALWPAGRTSGLSA